MPPAASHRLILLSVFILTAATYTAATDHIVGANKGWNPGINYTLWANNHTFYVGDFISFTYQKTQYNVFEVNQTGYDNCTTEGALGNWTSGKDFILLKKAKRYYFIGGNGQCFNGMKVSVVVHPFCLLPLLLVFLLLMKGRRILLLLGFRVKGCCFFKLWLWRLLPFGLDRVGSSIGCFRFYVVSSHHLRIPCFWLYCLICW